MSEISFSGPIDVSPELAMALFKSMPDVGRSGVAQLFFSRFVTAPISDAALVAGAKVFFERERIGTEAAKALREGVAEKCRALGEKSVNEAAVNAIVADETRKAIAEYVRGKMEAILPLIPLDVLVDAAKPSVVGAVQALGQQYFTRTQEGQQWILQLIDRVKKQEESDLGLAISERLRTASGVLPKTGDNGKT